MVRQREAECWSTSGQLFGYKFRECAGRLLIPTVVPTPWCVRLEPEPSNLDTSGSMTFLAFLLNLPWTVVGMCGVTLSGPRNLKFSRKPFALIFRVHSFWWWRFVGGKGKPRALANGHCVQLGPDADAADLQHELIHVEQAIREPFIHPFLYVIETRRRGYRHNKYEEEAYSRSGSRYTG